MLKNLLIRNFALIDNVSIDFNGGFTVITGETGSGKSIMLGALGLILGERADLKSIKDVASKCVVEGTFELSDTQQFIDFFKQNDIDLEQETILRREITPSGKSRAFINDTPVKLSVLKQLGERLIDIHSQHQTQQINSVRFQHLVLDTASSSRKEFDDYTQEFKNLKQLEQQLSELEQLQAEALTKQDFIRFQIEELSKVDLTVDKNQIEQEYNLLSNAEDVIRLSNDAENIINNDVAGVVPMLQQLEQTVEKLERIDESSYSELSKRINSCIIEIQDIDFEISNKISGLETNQSRLEELDDLLGEINHLEKKYNVTSLDELIKVKQNLEKQNNTFESLEEDIKKLKNKIAQQLENVLKKGAILSKLRQKGIEVLTRKIEQYLSQLAMPNARFDIEVCHLEAPSEYGLDTFSFLIKTNKGQKFAPLQKVASGGELSRIMFAIKAIIAESGNLSTLIFDEIDTGVSGEVANKMGEMMQNMGNNIQLISITHLPQIAAKGKNHLKVEKTDGEERTETSIYPLSENQRLTEIATMLSGIPPSKAAIDNAKELLCLQ